MAVAEIAGPSPQGLAAQRYAALGLHVFPVGYDKSPLTPNGYKDATTDPRQITAWWRANPSANIGVRVRDCGLLVVDFDVKDPAKDGAATWQTLRRRHGEMPRTVQAETGSGGRHDWFRLPAGVTVRYGSNTLGLGIDTPNYVLAAPSRTQRGMYRWRPGLSPDDVPLAEVPKWVLDLLTQPATPEPQNGPPASTDESLSELVQLALEHVERSGSRDEGGFWFAQYCRDTLRLSESSAMELQREYHAHVTRLYPKEGEPPYTLDKALKQVVAAYAQPRRDPASLPQRLRPRQRQQRRGREEPVILSTTAHTDRAADIEPEPINWLWPGRIPLGKVVILDGDPGLGKSTMLLDVAARFSRGDAMPDGTRGHLEGPQSVLVLSAEDDPKDTIRPRLDVARADLSRVHLLHGVEDRLEGDQTSGERPPSIPEDLPTIREVVEQYDIRLIVIDPLMAYLTGKANSFSDQDVRKALAPLATLAQATGAAIIAVRHLNKDGKNGNPLYRGGGSIGIIGAARVGLLVAASPDMEGMRELAVIKSNLASVAPALLFAVIPETVTIKGQPRELTRIEWRGASEHTAEQLLAAGVHKAEGGGTKTAEAATFLRLALAEGARPAEEVTAEAEEAGISSGVLKRARYDVVRVKAYRVGGKDAHWMWKLPEPVGWRYRGSDGEWHEAGGKERPME